jgi:hypothetical protein
MFYVEIISSINDINPYDNILFFGYSEDYIQEKTKQYQKRFLGEIGDGKLSITTQTGESYTAIFKAKEAEFYASPPNYLFLKEEDNVIINANGKVYRFGVNEKKCSSIIDYQLPFSSSYHPYTLSSEEYKIMVLIINEGILALTWEKELWRKSFEYASTGELDLLSIQGKHINLRYSPPWQEYAEELKINLFTGDEL